MPETHETPNKNLPSLKKRLLIVDKYANINIPLKNKEDFHKTGAFAGLFIRQYQSQKGSAEYQPGKAG